jgi:hypothetical protein
LDYLSIVFNHLAKKTAATVGLSKQVHYHSELATCQIATSVAVFSGTNNADMSTSHDMLLQAFTKQM